MELSGIFRKIILENECGGNEAVALEFSDADGVRTGKSGYSFAVAQFDLANNPKAAICLRECGFYNAEIEALKAQALTPEGMKSMNAKLKGAADVVAKWDTMQLEGCIAHVKAVFAHWRITPQNDIALLAAADWDNQASVSSLNKPGYLVHFLLELKRPFIASDVFNYKLGTPWGRKRPDDCHRRYKNIISICEKENVPC